MKSNRKYWQSVMAALAIIVGLINPALAPLAGTEDEINLIVFQPFSKPFHKTFEEWNAEWWQFMLSLPASVNPLLDDSGEDCVVGQHGPVWFLAGTARFTIIPNPNPDEPPRQGKATRTCTVPPDVAFLVPILNCEADNLGVDPPLKVDELRAFCKDNIDSATNLFLEVDGAELKNFAHFRFTSPVFNYTLPKDNLVQAQGFDFGPQTVFPVVAEGYYVMLKPLATGEHTIRFGGANNFISLEIIYHLDVKKLELP